MKMYPRRLSPPWLDGPITVYELTAYTARKLAKSWGLRLPRRGYCLVAPKSEPRWKELHHNHLSGSEGRPFYVFD